MKVSCCLVSVITVFLCFFCKNLALAGQPLIDYSKAYIDNPSKNHRLDGGCNTQISRPIGSELNSLLFLMQKSQQQHSAKEYIFETFRNGLNSQYDELWLKKYDQETFHLVEKVKQEGLTIDPNACGQTARAVMWGLKEHYHLDTERRPSTFEEARDLVLSEDIHRGAFLFRVPGHAFVIEKAGPDSFNFYQSFIEDYTLLEFLRKHEDFSRFSRKVLQEKLEIVSRFMKTAQSSEFRISRDKCFKEVFLHQLSEEDLKYPWQEDFFCQALLE